MDEWVVVEEIWGWWCNQVGKDGYYPPGSGKDTYLQSEAEAQLWCDIFNADPKAALATASYLRGD